MTGAPVTPGSDWFGAPEAAFAFGGVALLAWLLAIQAQRRHRRVERVIGPRAGVLAAERSAGWTRLRARTAIVGLACVVLAGMQPRLPIGRAAASPPAADLCICLDVSRSMLAGDLQPHRLAFAQQAIAELGERARGDRIALVVFAGQARLRVPLTTDVDALVEIARAADPADVPLGGTDLAAAIDAGVAALAAGRNPTATDAVPPLDGALLLVTDGEDPSGSGRAAAERARARGVRVHCIGVGSALGSKITVRGPDGRQTFLRDRAGNDVLTRLDAQSLRALVAGGDGVYVDAIATAAPLVAAYERGVLPELAPTDAAGEATLAQGFQAPLLLGLLALLAELLLPQRRFARWRRRGGVG